MAENCTNCRFSKIMTVIQRLVCRRYPPGHKVESQTHDSYFFPIVNNEEWCGEFQAKTLAEVRSEAEVEAQTEDQLDIEQILAE